MTINIRKKRGHKKSGVRYDRYGYFFAIPFLAFSFFFTLYPLLSTLVYSFSSMQGMSALKQGFSFVGWSNYSSVLKKPQFWRALNNVCVEWGCSAAVEYPLQLLVVYFFTSRIRNIKGQGAMKFIFYLPNLIGLTTICTLFSSLLTYPDGPINTLLTNLNLISSDINFMNNTSFVRGLISYTDSWRYWAVGLLMLLAAAKGINPELYEAAEIDGANSVQMFFRITIPGIKKVMLYLYVSGICGGLQMYEIPFLLGGTKPQTFTMSIYIRNLAFSGEYRYGWASAASFMFFVVLGSLSLLMMKFMGSGDSRIDGV